MITTFQLASLSHRSLIQKIKFISYDIKAPRNVSTNKLLGSTDSYIFKRRDSHENIRCCTFLRLFLELYSSCNSLKRTIKQVPGRPHEAHFPLNDVICTDGFGDIKCINIYFFPPMAFYSP
jgi:hypothetical protein